MQDQKTILILYYTRGVYPLRSTIHDHLYAFKNYSRHRVVYINAAFGVPRETLSRLNIDVIIYHTSFCGMRWSPEVFYNFTAEAVFLNDHPALKIAIPQDEFIHSDMLCELIRDAQIDWVLSCAYASEWSKIYAEVPEKTKILTVLTGYLDEGTVRRVSAFHKPMQDRKTDIAYRAWRAPFWLGEHGTLKVKVGEIVRDAALNLGLRCDISLDDAATILGDDWLKFMADARATVGVEGGASVLDHDGSLKSLVEAYCAANPDADFEAVRKACFAARDHELDLACLSPRHLEAAMTKTAQILIEGDYNGILQKDVHYLPLKPDFSNLSEILERLKDESALNTMVERAHKDVVQSNLYTYRGFVEGLERDIIDAATTKGADKTQENLLRLFDWRDRLGWWFIKTEVALIAQKSRLRLGLLMRLLRVFFAIPEPLK